jgi:hypothetical protein
MNTAWASLQGFDSAIFGYSGVQRSIGGVPLSLLTWLGSGSEGQAGLVSPIARFEIFAAQDDEGALGPRQMLPDPLSRRD